MSARFFSRLALGLPVLMFSGCLASGVWQWVGERVDGVDQQVGLDSQQPQFPNPLLLRVDDRELLWNELVDTVDDFFRISREQRVQLVGNSLTDGLIETVPQPAATMLEPWRDDSLPGEERRQATYQSIRERAELRVRPVPDGYQLEVVVQRELEDLDRPEFATVGGATLRHDGTLTGRDRREDDRPTTLGWIPAGRNRPLEQAILARLQQRLAAPVAPRPLTEP